MILSSTANLFAEPAHIPIIESEAIIPDSPHGESKHMLERDLGWQRSYSSLHEILETAWRWHTKYPDGYET